MELKPCPFCGAARSVLRDAVVRCGKCGATGPFGASDELAAIKWNTRVNPAGPGPEPNLDADAQLAVPDADPSGNPKPSASVGR